jgi:hypothetical protein
MSKKVEANTLCGACVYYPSNLPQQFYTAKDWQVLQQLSCAYEHTPGSDACRNTRKSHCDLVDLRAMVEIPQDRDN